MPPPQDDPVRRRRAIALTEALIAAGHSGSCVVARSNAVTLDPPFTAAHQQIADGWDWTDAGDLATQRTAAVDLAVSGADAMALGTRALAVLSATRDNDQAEALAALLDLLRVTPAALAERIALRRQTTPATPGAPDPAGVVLSATTRLGAGTVLATIAGHIAAGAGDPTG